MAVAAPVRDYAGAVLIFSAAAIFAGCIILSPFDSGHPGFTSLLTLSRNALFIGGAGASAAVASRLLRPLAHRLAAHQYFLRPIVMGLAVVAMAHLQFGLIVSPPGAVLAMLAQSDYHFEVRKFIGGVLLLSYITLPAGILAAYCVEIVGWIREDAARRRRVETIEPSDA